MIFTEEQKKYIGPLVIASLAVLVVLLGALALNTLKNSKYIGTGGDIPNTLTFSGQAEIKMAPDLAKITFGVEHEDMVVAVAQEKVSGTISVVLDGLEKLSVEEKDIRTNSYTTNPRYDWNDGTQVLKGYTVRQDVEVIVRDLDDVNRVIALLGESNVTNIYGPSFEIEDKEGVQRLARQEAITIAREKAEELAEDLGVKLVRIVSFTEGATGGYPMPMMAMESSVRDMKSSPELPTGENTISAEVSITYEIQ